MRFAAGPASCRLPLPAATSKHHARAVDLGRGKSLLGGDLVKQRGIGGDVFKHRRKKRALASDAPEVAGIDAGEGEKAAEPLGLSGEPGKDPNRQRFRMVKVECRLMYAHPFAFP